MRIFVVVPDGPKLIVVSQIVAFVVKGPNNTLAVNCNTILIGITNTGNNPLNLFFQEFLVGVTCRNPGLPIYLLNTVDQSAIP